MGNETVTLLSISPLVGWDEAIVNELGVWKAVQPVDFSGTDALMTLERRVSCESESRSSSV